MKKFLQGLGKYIDQLSRLGGTLAGLTIFGISIIVVFEIIQRELFNESSAWVNEYSMYGLVATGFLGAAFTAQRHRHIHLDVFTSRLSEKTREWLEFVTLFWSILFCVIVSYSAFKMVNTAIEQDMRSMEITRTPLWIPELTVLIGGVLLTLQLLKLTIDKGMHLTQIKEEAAPQKTFLTPVDKPLIIIPLFIALLAFGTVLFCLTGSFQAIGLTFLLLVMLATGTPIFISIGLLGSAGLFILLGTGIASQLQVALIGFQTLTSFTLCALPLFIFAGALFALSGLTDSLFDLCSLWLSRLPGNLAMATMVTCALFAAMCGSSVATAATIGLIAVPAMIKRGYEPSLAVGTSAVGGTLATMIPPSLHYILYGELTESSIGQLFMAGVFPGIMLVALYMGYIYLKCRKDPRYAPPADVSWKARIAALKRSWLMLLIPVIVLGGIYSGIFTPTEAAAVAVIYGLFLCILTGRLRWKTLVPAMRDCTLSSCMVLMIIFGAMVFGSVVTILQIPQAITKFVMTASIPLWALLLSLTILWLILGCFLDVVAIMVITIPIVFPPLKALGVDPIWLGVFSALTMEIGMVTPPFGINLFTIQGVTKQKFETVVKGVAPFLVAMLLGLIIIWIWSPLSTWLPMKMFGR